MTQHVVKIVMYALIDAPSVDYARGLVMGSASSNGPKGIQYIQIVEGSEEMNEPVIDLNEWLDETGGF